MTLSVPFGSPVAITVTFRDENGDLYNPTSYALNVKPPSGGITKVPLVNVSTGTFTARLLANSSGEWHIRSQIFDPGHEAWSPVSIMQVAQDLF